MTTTTNPVPFDIEAFTRLSAAYEDGELAGAEEAIYESFLRGAELWLLDRFDAYEAGTLTKAEVAEFEASTQGMVPTDQVRVLHDRADEVQTASWLVGLYRAQYDKPGSWCTDRSVARASKVFLSRTQATLNDGGAVPAYVHEALDLLMQGWRTT